MLNYLKENQEWLFQGVGVTILTAIGVLITKLLTKSKEQKDKVDKGNTYNFTQSSGDNSKNFQGQTLNINQNDEGEKK